MNETSRLIAHISIAVVISVALIVISYIITTRQPNQAKISPYECGYDASYKVTKTLDIKYYIIAILFLIFDLEISYVYPFIMIYPEVIKHEYITMIYLLVILTLGFIYEWRIGALKW